ncbi:type III secretion system needle length determinant [Pseudomonas putida]|uniref:type III secretion system needle length determinant n=1 Tax=Pseudomonas putida TaxID=303 RepID=UPI0023637432|nr:type III secretion system needle length determinant [Pseudomonas putida]MDD2052469.1 type III secretion system needle length determinant [Pseudomonas putida]
MIPTLPPPCEPTARVPDNARPGEVDRSRQVEFEHAMRQRADKDAQEQARQPSRYSGYSALAEHKPRPAESRSTASLPGHTFKQRPLNERRDPSHDSDSSSNQASTDAAQANAPRQPTNKKPRDKVQDRKGSANKAKATPDTPNISARQLLLDKSTLKTLEALLGQSQSTEHKTQSALEPLALALPNQTPGDRLLAQLLAEPQTAALKKDLEQLLTAMQARIQSHTSPGASNSTLLQINLQHLGTVEIQLAQHRGVLYIELQASSGTLLHLQQARGELLERLNKLNPGQETQLAFADSGDAEQRSRQRRQLEDEWEPEP